MVALDYQIASESRDLLAIACVCWMRGFDIVWNVIEPEKGKYDWKENDKMLTEFKGGQEGEIYHLSIIWPYANWDPISWMSMVRVALP